MLYLDSWVWLEYVLGGDTDGAVASVLEEAHENGATTSAIALAEIDYIVRRELDRETADYVTSGIEDVSSIHVAPVTSDVALRASGIRSKYYSRRERELSYADAIHIATALQMDCTVIHTGDTDFEAIEEIRTVIHR